MAKIINFVSDKHRVDYYLYKSNASEPSANLPFSVLINIKDETEDIEGEDFKNMHWEYTIDFECLEQELFGVEGCHFECLQDSLIRIFEVK